MLSLRSFVSSSAIFVLVNVVTACGGDSDDNSGSVGTGGSSGSGGGGGSSAAAGSAGTGGSVPDSVPDFSAATFSSPTTIDNPFLPLTPGIAHAYVAKTDGDTEVIIVEVLDETRAVMGIDTRVVRDRVFVGDWLIEDTHDWFAQDDDGNVWYMGEEVDNYEYDEDGNITSVDHEGAWEGGKDVADTGMTALPGYMMLASPTAGQKYHQEYYPGEAEDMGEVVALDVSIDLEDGSSYSALQTLDSEPSGGSEYKYYVQEIGVVLEETTAGNERLELVGIFDTTDASLPDFDGATFSASTTIDNPFMSWTPGQTLRYEAETEDGTEEIVIEVLSETRVVAGVTCVVVRDRVYLDGVIIEDTHDWYAQDDAGNVWYMGEEVDNYNYEDDGTLIGISHEGAWEAGLDVANAGVVAKPGIVMLASPAARTSYRQEFYEGEAEDMAFIVRTDATVELSDGTVYTNCIQTLDWVPLDPSALEYKFYAQGIGMVAETTMDGEERVELTSNQ